MNKSNVLWGHVSLIYCVSLSLQLQALHVWPETGGSEYVNLDTFSKQYASAPAYQANPVYPALQATPVYTPHYPSCPTAEKLNNPPLALPVHAIPVSSPTRVKIAAAEALYYGRLKGTELGYRERALLKRLIEDKPTTNESEHDVRDISKTFLSDVQQESLALKRMDQKISTKKPGKQSRGFCSRWCFTSAEQFADEIRAEKPNNKLKYVRSNMEPLPELTHEELFTILAAFPKTEQMDAYILLASKVFTRMSFYSADFYNDAMDKIDIKIFAEQLRKTGSLFWEGIDANHPEIDAYVEELLKSPFLSGPQLLYVLRIITNPTKAQCVDDLIPLRNKVRVFAGFDKKHPGINEWTASDLYIMEVPLNVQFLIRALDLTNGLGPCAAEATHLVQGIMRTAQRIMIPITHNALKSHMWPPQKRGVDPVVIIEMINAALKRVAGYR